MSLLINEEKYTLENIHGFIFVIINLDFYLKA